MKASHLAGFCRTDVPYSVSLHVEVPFRCRVHNRIRQDCASTVKALMNVIFKMCRTHIETLPIGIVLQFG